MIDILLAGVGGQGTVLAAKVLAQAAQSKGWQVRTAETIGMAQRGGNVTSHVRMGSNGGAVYSPLITPARPTWSSLWSRRGGPRAALSGAGRCAGDGYDGHPAGDGGPGRASPIVPATWWQLWRTPCRRRRPASKRPKRSLRRTP